jgi:NADH-quinone oxidoreductase subunit G
MPTIFVDGQAFEVKEGANVLEACLSAGIDLPYFCWHPSMGSIGSCRQCAVVQYQNAEDTNGRIVMGCMTPVSEGARFSLNSGSGADQVAYNAVDEALNTTLAEALDHSPAEALDTTLAEALNHTPAEALDTTSAKAPDEVPDKGREFRQAVIESLMLNHPHDCPVCAEGGECHLQDMTVMVGHRDRRYRGLKNTHRNQYLGPLISHEMNRCITCYRCERFYTDYAGGTDLSAQASHDHVYFGRHQDGVLESEFSGNLVEVCPTGVFTDKPLLKQYSRKWDLQSAPSICTGCAVGCNILPGERYGKLKRIHNRYNDEVNGYFLCDRGRFGSGYINSDARLNYAGLRNDDGKFSAIKAPQAIEIAAQWMKSEQGEKAKKVVGIGSPRASLEANYLLRELVGKDHFAGGFSDRESQVIHRIAAILKTTRAKNPSIKQMETADAVLILGEDVTHTAPRVALGLRQAVRNKAHELAKQAGLAVWQDAAVRNLAQDQRSPMIIVSATDTRLDDVASQTVSLAPNEIALFGHAVARAIGGQPSDDESVNQAAAALKNAQRPLVISGSSMLNTALVDSAAAVADALTDISPTDNISMLSFCLPECNSLGLALLSEEQETISRLLARTHEIDVLVILENNLSRRISEQQILKLTSSGIRIVALDMLDNDLLASCDLVLSAASYAESEGTLVSSEGRAQRYYPVFPAVDERLASWQWLRDLAAASGHSALAELQHFDQITAACGASNKLFAPLSGVSPDHNFRSHGQKIPRQTHRASGRTAINANVSVHEPLRTLDQETPLSFSMEGLNRDQPAALTPFYWSPGWNSNQALQKFQSEVNGPLRGGPAGQRLIEPQDNGSTQAAEFTPLKIVQEGTWQLVPMYRVHGSDELSVRTAEVAELAGEAFIAIGPALAEQLAVVEGDGVKIHVEAAAGIEGTELSIPISIPLSLSVKILSRVAPNCVAYSAGYRSTLALQPGALALLSKDAKWQRATPQLIASDRSSSKHAPKNHRPAAGTEEPRHV